LAKKPVPSRSSKKKKKRPKMPVEKLGEDSEVSVDEDSPEDEF
jgi:hypothetical protein